MLDEAELAELVTAWPGDGGRPVLVVTTAAVPLITDPRTSGRLAVVPAVDQVFVHVGSVPSAVAERSWPVRLMTGCAWDLAVALWACPARQLAITGKHVVLVADGLGCDQPGEWTVSHPREPGQPPLSQYCIGSSLPLGGNAVSAPGTLVSALPWRYQINLGPRANRDSPDPGAPLSVEARQLFDQGEGILAGRSFLGRPAVAHQRFIVQFARLVRPVPGMFALQLPGVPSTFVGVPVGGRWVRLAWSGTRMREAQNRIRDVAR